jgi:hypothetical protein
MTMLTAVPSAAEIARRPVEIDLPLPPIGGKCWLLENKGLFVLARGPGVLRTIACTHAGSGSLEAIDGVPSEDGYFPRPDADETAKQAFARNGRILYRATPVIMGSWLLDAGFIHGLTIRAGGGHQSASAVASIVWMPVRATKVDAA